MRRLLRRSVRQVRHVRPVPAGSAQGLVAEVYDQLEGDFGMLAPPVALHSPAPRVLAASWTTLRETLLAGTTRRADREAVAAAISASNSCPYCVEVHTSTLRALSPGRDAPAPAPDGNGRADGPARLPSAAWALQERPARYTAEEAAELAGVAVTFQYLNRMVNVFLEDSVLPSEVPAALRGPLSGRIGRFLRPNAHVEPGRSLGLLPEAVLPADMAWAAGSPTVADAYARAASAVDAAGRRVVPRPVRDLVEDALDAWDGTPPPMGRAWVREATAGLGADLAPVAVLTLTTAMASYQVAPSDVAAFREIRPDDRALVEAAAWASMTAARRLGARLWDWHLSSTERHPS
ncbi:carboxymuconolactone decarboxylase family protein [Actinomadura harenae]|uniref:Carboxymuconolactone decarboxylase family protein n=1 Tax=Actinomadura harenae TaxID=2483351 RepID=A0A3M2LUY4_9ACTN|nr:carboxymuconolactone decarboxylase family protein [Actinomadura harenae]RMI40720.1 carboxymuconolactone decarboxylase family protein [Actinomadura harenae]